MKHFLMLAALIATTSAMAEIRPIPQNERETVKIEAVNALNHFFDDPHINCSIRNGTTNLKAEAISIIGTASDVLEETNPEHPGYVFISIKAPEDGSTKVRLKNKLTIYTDSQMATITQIIIDNATITRTKVNAGSIRKPQYVEKDITKVDRSNGCRI